MIAIKPGVRVRAMQPEILLAVVIAHELFRERAERLVITSCTDGRHKDGSLHYTGCAVDLRLPMLTVQRDQVVKELAERLSAEYDVVLEADHIHVEYDPK